MRRVLGTVGALAVTLVVLGLVVGLVLAGARWPAVGRAAPAVDVVVPPAAVDLVCPGPPRLAADDLDDGAPPVDPAFDRGADAVATSATALTLGRTGIGAAEARWSSEPGRADAGAGLALAPAGAASSSAVRTDLAGPSVVTAEPAGGVAALVAGAVVARADSGDLRGLAAARCLPAVTSAWLVAGSGEVGSSARLLLANPGATPATVTLEVWGATGPVDPGPAGTVLVPARGERAVLLESFAVGQARLAVHLTVAGGAVAPFLQDARLRGFVPAGVDLAEPVAEPAEAVVVPLVLEPSEIDAADPAVLRVVNPGEEPATVRLRLLGADGPDVVPGAEERVVDPGTVADISLAGVPAGAYAAEILADRPVTAAAMLTRAGSPGRDAPDEPVVDRAWIGAAPAVTTALLTLPGLGDTVDAARVVLANPGTGAIRLLARAVLPGGGVGEAFALDVGAGASVEVDGARLAGALALAVALEPGDADGAAPGSAASFVGAAVLLANAADGPLVAAVGAQADPQEARSVAIRLPNR